MSDFRAKVRDNLKRLATATPQERATLAETALTESCVWDVAAPVNRLSGRQSVVTEFLDPMSRAFAGLERRDEIVIGGENRRDSGGRWVAIVTHYVGTFTSPLFGLQPSGRLSFFRSGEFYRIEGERIAEAKIIFDIPDLARQSGRLPFSQIMGTEMLFPGPATHDGVCPESGDGEATLAIVEGMLSDLHVYDPETSGSKGQTGPEGRWDENMLWYGPAGIGSTYRWEGFVDNHRAAFLAAFPDRVGGNHYCRIGDGNYAAVSGWPSMTMTHLGDYLGVPATGKALTLRVMDFYRCAHGKIKENWVCLDYVELFEQMGVDLIARANAIEPR